MKITYSKDEYILEELSILNLQAQTYCIIDCEGTGINYRSEYITQVGAITLTLGDNDDQNEAFSSLVRSPKQIPKEIEALTGIHNQDLIAAPSFTEIYDQLSDYIKGAIVVTQAGYEYDIPLLERHCHEHSLPLFRNQVIDTKALFAWIHPEVDEVISTNYLLNYYGIATDDLKRHDALDDCILIGRIFREILNEYSRRGISDFTIASKLVVKRFKVPGMAVGEGE